jgi:hypothetical protein
MARSRFEECKSDELPEAVIVRLSMKLLVFQRLGCGLILDKIQVVSE